MTKYEVTIERSDGSQYAATKEADSTFALYEEFRMKGERVLEAKKIEGGKMLGLKKLLSKIGSVSMQEKIIFARNMGGMLKAGLPLARSLSVVERQTKNKKFKNVISSVEDSIKQGASFHEALEKHPKVFPEIFAAMVKAGEESGNLSNALVSVSAQMDRVHSLQKKVKGAMIYPTVIITVMIIIGALMMVMVVPGITSTFAEANVELPWSTQMIIFISNLLKNNIILVLMGFLVAVISFLGALRTKPGKRVFHYFILHIPVIGGLVKETNTARTARTLSSLLSGGVDVLVSLSIARDVLQNTYYKEVLALAQARVEKGEKLSQIFSEHENIYPSFISEMASVGEETGQISDMFGNVASFYEEEVERRTKDMSTIIEPFLMVLIGGAVGFFAYSMITPMYTLMGSI